MPTLYPFCQNLCLASFFVNCGTVYQTMFFVPHWPLHSNIGLNLSHFPPNYFTVTCTYSELFVSVNSIFLFTVLCVTISYVHYLYYCFSFYCRAGFVLALGCYLPSPIICIYIKLIERKEVHLWDRILLFTCMSMPAFLANWLSTSWHSTSFAYDSHSSHAQALYHKAFSSMSTGPTIYTG